MSDIFYQAAENKNLVDNIKQYLNAFTEKKVEVFHSVLRRFVKTPSDKHHINYWQAMCHILKQYMYNIDGRSILSVVEC